MPFDDQAPPADALLAAGWRNREKMLPSHPVMRSAFRGDDDAFWRRLEAVTNSVLPAGSAPERWSARLKPGVTYETLGSDLATIYHLGLLLRLMQCRRVLEIGTFVGVSTMFIADAIGAAGHVTTIEIGAEFADIARENFKRSGLQDRIELINDDVNAVLPMLGEREPFDLIFLDGCKQDYGRLLAPLLELLRPGGLLYVDNTFLHGDVLNELPATDKGRGVADMLARAATLADHPRVILPYGDGHLLIMKPRNEIKELEAGRG